MRWQIVLQHSKPIVRLFIKAPKLVHMLTNVFRTILDMEPLEILADQGTISGGSISRIVRNTLFYICTNFGAFMQIWTIDLKYQTTLQDYGSCSVAGCPRGHTETFPSFWTVRLPTHLLQLRECTLHVSEIEVLPPEVQCWPDKFPIKNKLK